MHSATPLREPTILTRARRGDGAAFAEIVARYDVELLKVCFIITGDSELAREATQIAWTKAWTKLAQLRDDGRLHAWLVAIAANEARRQRRRRRLAALIDSALYVRGDSAEEVRRDEHVDLRIALSRLNAADRQLLALRYLASMTSPEIADVIGGSASTVRVRLTRLHARLRRELDGE